MNRVERFRGKVPIVVILYHREEDTREVLSQLAKVTTDYELIFIDNGFDDADYILGLNPASHVRNDENVGITRAVNQGLEIADGPYVAVLHSDLLIYEEGWLEHIIEFMERRPNVGLVSLIGRHCIKEDGSLDEETLVCNLPEYQDAFQPSWRFTEIAAADGTALVMRNLGFRVDESLSSLHYYDIDMSMQYISAGYRVYNANVELYHLREEYFRQGEDSGAARTSGREEDEDYIEARSRFRDKWSHMLPICRGFMDEQYYYHRVEWLKDHAARLELEYSKRGEEIERAKEYVGRLTAELDRVSAENQQRAAEIDQARDSIRGLNDELALARSPLPDSPPAGASILERIGFSLRTRGVRATLASVLGRLKPRVK